MTNKFDETKTMAENSLYDFIRLIAPHRVLGNIHREVIEWWGREDASSHLLLLLPRDHQKSALVGYKVAWHIINNPDCRILYISSTSNLAKKQLKFIKDILTTPTFTRYWPEFVNKEESKREKWTTEEISIDHPKRAEEGVRDPTITTAGLTTSLTGTHCDVAVFDDVVVQENAYTGEGRQKVRTQYSLLASIEGTDARQWVVGTRYHPKDLYHDMITMKVPQYSNDNEVVGELELYEKFEKQVENIGDGTGEFLWPRQSRYDGKQFGFDVQILARKKAQYLDRTQFRAQYYNDPNDPSGGAINRDSFQYYNKSYLGRKNGKWYYKNTPLNVFAAIDFAYSTTKSSDYSALVVVGIDAFKNIYVLDIQRFKTEKISVYFKHILEQHVKWGFRKLRAEVTAAQKAIVKELKDNYIKSNGLALSIDEHRPTRHQGSKEERINAILEPRYDNQAIWHYESGNCQILEEELVAKHPPHDDVKDALAAVVEIAIPPIAMQVRDTLVTNVVRNRFGGHN